MPTQNMDDFVMKSKWTILHMWIISLEYTGIDPTLCIESTLWYPSSPEKACELLSEDWLWMNFSWKSSFWARKSIFADRCAHMQCTDNFTKLKSFDLQISWRIYHPWRRREHLSVLVSTMCYSLPCFYVFLPIRNHLNLRVNAISNFSVRELICIDISKYRKII